ncbi:MAG: rod shape-determining protein [Firmicutes bacterium]|nr:rod shape-determining protein [Bacillota bacterium]
MVQRDISYYFSRLIAIDLGSTNTTIYNLRRGKIKKVPTLIALDRVSKTVEAVGDKAKEMLGRAPARYHIIAPVRNGAIANFDAACKLLKQILWQDQAIKRWPSIVAVNIPYGSSQVEKQAVKEAVRSTGSKEIHLVESPLAAMMGIELPYNPLQGSMIVDLGGGTTEIAVIALGGIVLGSSLKKGGEELDQSLQSYFRKKYLLNIGQRVAEKIKLNSAYLLHPPERKIKVAGIFLESRLPGHLEIKISELQEVWQSHFNDLALEIQKVFERTPPELVSDIVKQGIFLAGGGALMRSLGEYLQQRTSLPVKIPEHPADCTVKGLAKVLMSKDGKN